MNHNAIEYRYIGVIWSEHRKQEDTPIQPAYAEDSPGRVEVFPEYAPGLLDIEGFSHIYLLYHFHHAEPPQLIVRPFLQDEDHGVFATRAPCRPNGIGLSIVRLLRREKNILHVGGADMLNGTPLLDIKPYTAKFDNIETTCNGWQDFVDDPTANLRGKRGYA